MERNPLAEELQGNASLTALNVTIKQIIKEV
jgi:hypothetical protein